MPLYALGFDAYFTEMLRAEVRFTILPTGNGWLWGLRVGIAYDIPRR